jgi:catechol 2,3-dioxygenase-like lactoylglutathione lyase family enzyme
MFDHLGLKVNDLARSIGFYRAVLTPLGFQHGSEDASGAMFGPPGAPALTLAPEQGTLTTLHLAFTAADRTAVNRFYNAGLEAGGRDNGKPGVRADYGPDYYAAFLLDPDGNNVEAVCQKPQK